MHRGIAYKTAAVRVSFPAMLKQTKTWWELKFSVCCRQVRFLFKMTEGALTVLLQIEET